MMIVIGVLAVVLVGALGYILHLTEKKAKIEKELNTINEKISYGLEIKNKINKNSSDSIDNIRKRMLRDAYD